MIFSFYLSDDTRLKSIQDKIRQTKENRADPIRRTMLDDELCQLGIAEKGSRLAVDLSRYSINAILRGVANYKTKLEMNTIPKDADPGRYLGGIIRNLNTREELELTSTHLLNLRIKHNNLSLEPLMNQMQELKSKHTHDELPLILLKQALDAISIIDFSFWGKEVARDLKAMSSRAALDTYVHLCKITSACFTLERERREDLIAWLSEAASDNSLDCKEQQANI
jgi:hypothetical protein